MSIVVLMLLNANKPENGTQEKFRFRLHGLRGSKHRYWQAEGSQASLIEVNRRAKRARYSSANT